MKVIKDRQIVEDGFQRIRGDEPLPLVDVVVDLERWNRDRGLLATHPGQVGVALHSDETPDRIQDLHDVPLVAIEFPSFTDGRGYSTARWLRQRLGYRGELRALGNVLRDQLFYMARCGFDSFALETGKDALGALSAFDDFSVTYQMSADDPLPLFRRVQR